jgi:hypothetical protein
VIMVHASPEAEAIAKKSGLSVTDLLRPFTSVEGSFNVSTVGDPYQLKGFALRFVHTTEFKELAGETADAHLLRLLASYDCEAELADTEKVDIRLPDGPAPGLPPLRSPSTAWIGAFRAQLASALRHSEGASLDHPVGCVLVASASQPKPSAVFSTLLSAANLTPVIADGHADPGYARTCILLHDVSDPAVTAAAAKTALSDASRALGASACHLVTGGHLDGGAPAARQPSPRRQGRAACVASSRPLLRRSHLGGRRCQAARSRRGAAHAAGERACAWPRAARGELCGVVVIPSAGRSSPLRPPHRLARLHRLGRPSASSTAPQLPHPPRASLARASHREAPPGPPPRPTLDRADAPLCR